MKTVRFVNLLWLFPATTIADMKGCDQCMAEDYFDPLINKIKPVQVLDSKKPPKESGPGVKICTLYSFVGLICV